MSKSTKQFLTLVAAVMVGIYASNTILPRITSDQ